MLGFKTKISSFLQKFNTLDKISNDDKIRRLMRHFQADEHGHEANLQQADLGYGWIHYGLIRQAKPKKLLCIGSRHGYIPAVLAQACKDNGFGHVDFVDAGYGQDNKNHWTGVGYWKTTKGKKCFKNFSLEKYISLYITTTKKFAKKHPAVTYDYIYIDGDHSYQGINQDYNLFWPMLNRGGFMAFHDICVKENLPEGEYGVYKLWKRISTKNAISIHYPKSGLGIIQKNINDIQYKK